MRNFIKVVYYFRAHRLALCPDKIAFMLFSNTKTKKINKDIDNNNYSEPYNVSL
jgi:hypothetical protein